MSKSLLDCPNEIIVDILECNAIQFVEIRNLRLTHRSLRSIIDPLLFHTFRFSLDDAFDRSFAIASTDPSPTPVYHPLSKTEICGRHASQKFPNLTDVFHLWEDDDKKPARSLFGKKQKPKKAQQRGSYPWIPHGEHGFKVEERDCKGGVDLSLSPFSVQLEKYKLQARSLAQRSTWPYIRGFVKHINIEAVTKTYTWPSSGNCLNRKPDMTLENFLGSFTNLKSISWNVGDTEALDTLDLVAATQQIVNAAWCKLPLPTLTISASLSNRYVELYYSISRSMDLRIIDISIPLTRSGTMLSHGLATLLANAPNLTDVRLELQPDLWSLSKRDNESQFKCEVDMDEVFRTAAGLIEARAAGERDSPTLNLTKCEKKLSTKPTRDIKRFKLHNVYLPRGVEMMSRFLSRVTDLSYTFTLDKDDVWDNIAWNVLNEGYTPPNIETLTLSRLSTQALSFLRSIPDKWQLGKLSKLAIEPARYIHELPEYNPNRARPQQDAFADEFWSSVLPALKDTLKEFTVKGSRVSPAWMWTPCSPASAAIEELRYLQTLEICACGIGVGCNAHPLTQAVLRYNHHVKKLVIWCVPGGDRMPESLYGDNLYTTLYGDSIYTAPHVSKSCLVVPNSDNEDVFDLEGFDDGSRTGRTSIVVVYQKPKIKFKQIHWTQYGDIIDSTAYQLYKTIPLDGTEASTWQYRPIDIQPSALSYGSFSRQGFVEPECKAAREHDYLASSFQQCSCTIYVTARFQQCGCTMGTPADMPSAVKKYGLRAPYTRPR